MRAFVDRINGNAATILLGDDESVTVDIPRAWLPAGAREGIVLSWTLAVDESATAKAHEEISHLMDTLGDNP